MNIQVFFKMEQKKHGGARKGAGRKPKSDELSIIEKMDGILTPDDVWESLATLVKNKDHNAIKTWLSYRFGMPKQSINHSGYIAAPELPLTPEQAIEALKKLEEL